MNETNEKKNEEQAPIQDDAVKIGTPDPLSENDDIQRKIKTNRVPRPTPQKADATAAKSEEPISSETISIKRSDLKVETKPLIDPEKHNLKILCYHCGQKLDLSDMEPFSEVKCPSCEVEIIVPKWFENYLLEEPGGEGGMAIVYRALDLTLDREVAIKILHSSFSSEADKGQLFLHEARTAATINHYAVIPVYTCGISDGKPYIVMQYMDGGALDTKIEKENTNLPINQVIKWIKDVADGLDNARRHGIIHHDVKPANILLDKDDNAKIGDFGIAQVLHDWRSEKISKITKSWASPNYVSPEKVMTGQEDHYGDIYSLGISMFQLLTRKLPFDDPDVITLTKMRLIKDPPDIKELRPDIPVKIANLTMSMMHRDPDKRPSYREIINEIDAHLKLSEKVKKSAEKHVDKLEKSSKLKHIREAFNKKSLNSPEKTTPPEKAKSYPLTVIIHLSISILMFGGAYLIWKSGCLASIIGRHGSFAKIMPDDLIPEATALFRIGNSEKAGEIANTALENSESDLGEIRQAAIQTAISLYLQKLPDAKNRCLSISEKISSYGVDEDEPTMIIMRFMSNGEGYENKLKESFLDDDYYRALASYCLYIKAIFDKEDDLKVVSYSRRCLATGEKIQSDFWGNAWFNRIDLWKEWIEFGKGDPASLEALIVKSKYDPNSVKISQPKLPENPPPATKIPQTNNEIAIDIKLSDEKILADINLSTLTAKWLEEDRKTFANKRPRPSNYDFNVEETDKYIAGLDKARRENENIRFRQVSGMKNYLCHLLGRGIYDKGIKTSDGKNLSGQMTANPNYISIKSGKQFIRLNWEQIPASEMANVISHFAKLRLQISGAAGTSSDSREKEAAEDYLRIALLCDWYGEYDEAIKYAKKCLSVYPKSEKSIKKIIMK